MAMTRRNALIRDRELSKQAEEMPKRHFRSFFHKKGFTCANCQRWFPPESQAFLDQETKQVWCMMRDNCAAFYAEREALTKEQRKERVEAFQALLGQHWEGGKL